MELLLEVPPQTTATVSLQFNRAFLKWTEHPPDAHHGFYIKYVYVGSHVHDRACPTFLKWTELQMHTMSFCIKVYVGSRTFLHAPFTHLMASRLLRRGLNLSKRRECLLITGFWLLQWTKCHAPDGQADGALPLVETLIIL